MSIRSLAYAGIFALLGGSGDFVMAQGAQPKAFGDALICSSQDGRRTHCPADTRGGVVLRQQLSQARCIQGRTWDFDQRGVWVSEGCRGEFMLGDPGHGRPPHPGHPGPGGGIRPPHGGSDLVVCESIRDRRQFCPADTRGGVELVRRISSSSCVERHTWGWTREGIWVDRGCRAEFAVVRYQAPQGRLVVCESLREAPSRCAIGRVRSVELVRQLSSSPCRQNQTWGWDRNAIWVTRGCRGEFSVY